MSSQPFDVKPVLRDMVALYEARTAQPSVAYADAEYRVSWTDVKECMRRHGFDGDMLQARRLWETVAQQFNTACRKILVAHGEDPKKIRRRTGVGI